MELVYRKLDGEITPDDADIHLTRYPIVVDLDKTLILTDTLHEQVVTALFTQPTALIAATPKLLRGRAALKASLAAKIDLGSTALPLREDLVKWLRGQAAVGREIHLCSAANQAVVENVSRRVGIFASAIGSATANLKGHVKAEHLASTFPEGFVYVGDSRADLAVWKAADGIVLAGASPGVAKAARGLGKPIEAEFVNHPLTLRDSLKALRVHHWSKNALIFVPLILAHSWGDLAVVRDTILGLVCLLAVTSSTYLLNDLADLSADRQHWSKRNRALASGRLPIASGLLLACSGLIGAFAGSLVLTPYFTLALAGYLSLTLAYSFGLKRVPILDTLIIGILFTTRLIMGIALLRVPASAWLLTFSVFFFFSLAVAKRHTEIVRAASSGSHSLASRGYLIEDEPLTLALGVASAVASLLIIVLFIVEEMFPARVYTHPHLLAGIPVFLAIWIGRIWLLAHRGRMNDDPVSFALRDRPSILLGFLVAVLFVAAL
jgi:4-hydroxybenzoate polyprenyltransferase/phosphoserine phosphatase